MSNNKLVTIPEIIENLVNLKKLDLSYNAIDHLPNLGNLVNLRKLWLNDNKLRYLPESIGNIKELRWLNLVNNDLSNLPTSISNLNKLSKLIIDPIMRNNLSENMRSWLDKLKQSNCDFVVIKQ